MSHLLSKVIWGTSPPSASSRVTHSGDRAVPPLCVATLCLAPRILGLQPPHISARYHVPALQMWRPRDLLGKEPTTDAKLGSRHLQACVETCDFVCLGDGGRRCSRRPRRIAGRAFRRAPMRGTQPWAWRGASGAYQLNLLCPRQAGEKRKRRLLTSQRPSNSAVGSLRGQE